MTKKEKEIFRSHLDCVNANMVKAFVSGAESQIAVSQEVFIQMQGLWNELVTIVEQGE